MHVDDAVELMHERCEQADRLAHVPAVELAGVQVENLAARPHERFNGMLAGGGIGSVERSLDLDGADPPVPRHAWQRIGPG